MKTLYTSKFYEILFDETKSLILHKALPNTSKMNTEDFRQEMALFLETCEKHTPEKDLVQLVDMNYAIVPEDQEWVNQTIFPRLLNIIKRMALVVPAGLFESVALEQTMEEELGKKFMSRYFKNENEALEWLMLN
jgi:hypothetical protein